MNRWNDKVAVITGASSGIGAQIATDLLKFGLRVVALARREDRLRENQKSLPENLQERYVPIKCDLTCESDIIQTFRWIETYLGGVDILINNAGIMPFGVDLVNPDNSQTVRDVIDTNVMAVVFCTREAFKSMKRRNIYGHVVIINSIFGHSVPNLPGLNIYPASKFAVTALVDTFRPEFANSCPRVKVSSISPGGVDTELIPQEIKEQIKLLKAEDISNAIIYVLSTPPHVQVYDLGLQVIGATLPSPNHAKL